jgi:hypothetical protein
VIALSGFHCTSVRKQSVQKSFLKVGFLSKSRFLGIFPLQFGFSVQIKRTDRRFENAREREGGEIKSEKVCERKIEERDRVRKGGERVSEKE